MLVRLLMMALSISSGAAAAQAYCGVHRAFVGGAPSRKLDVSSGHFDPALSSLLYG